MLPYPDMLYSMHQSGCRVQICHISQVISEMVFIVATVEKALDVAGGRKQYERLLLEQRRSRTSSLYSCAYQPAMGTTFVTARYHSIEFNYLYCVALSVHRLVPHRPTSTAVVYQQGGTPTGWNSNRVEFQQGGMPIGWPQYGCVKACAKWHLQQFHLKLTSVPRANQRG